MFCVWEGKPEVVVSSRDCKSRALSKGKGAFTEKPDLSSERRNQSYLRTELQTVEIS